jgi:PAP2 superfamily
MADVTLDVGVDAAPAAMAALATMARLDTAAPLAVPHAPAAPRIVWRHAVTLKERSMALTTALLVLAAAVAAVWSFKTGLTLAPGAVQTIRAAGLAAVVCALIAHATAAALSETETRAAHLLSGFAKRLNLLAAGGVALLALAVTATVLAHLAWGKSDGSDLRDAAYIALDQRLRFDWTAALARLNRHPVFGHMLLTAQQIAPFLIAAPVLLLSLANRRRDLTEFLLAATLAVMAATVMLVLAPSAGAYAHLQPDAGLFSALNPEAGRAIAALLDAWHHTAVTGVSGTAIAGTVDLGRQIDPLAINIALAMPSLQAAVAVLVVYAVRRMRWIGSPVAALCVLVMLAPISDSGQYLSQVFAGGMLATGCILFAKALRYERRKKPVVAVAKVDRDTDFLTWHKPPR